MSQTYILGAEDDETNRLKEQHTVWEQDTQTVYQMAEFSQGQTLLDLGCGPGFTTFDLHQIVGKSGRVIAIDASEKFTQILNSHCQKENITNIDIHCQDVYDLDLPASSLDGAFARWLFCFLNDPATLIQHVSQALKPSGTFAILDYINYQAIGLQPPSEQFDHIFNTVFQSFQVNGGSLNVGGYLPTLLAQAGLKVEQIEPICHTVRPHSPIWNWVEAFQDVYVSTLVGKYFSQAEFNAFKSEWQDRSQDPNTFLFSPPMIKIVAQKYD